MSRSQRLLSVSALVCIVLVGSSVVASATRPPIRPDQHFIGLVNGRHLNVTVRTVCPGPAVTSSGLVSSGQTMAVVHVANGGGDTGLFSGIYVWFVPKQAGARPTSLHFKSYATPMSIPASIRVNCTGTGLIEFSSCPYLAPCAYGWVPSYVRVRFVNIAA